MATAGSIVVDLLLRTGAFETDAARAERRVAALAASTKKAFLGIAAGAGAAAVGLAVMVKNSIDSADELSKAATSIGMSTESLSAFKYAADLSGVASDELTSAFAKLNKNAVAAAEGSKSQSAAFSALGVTLVDTSGKMKDTESIMLQVMDAFAGLEEGPQKTAIAMEIFGKSGAKLIPLLNSGKEGMAAMREEAQKLGLIIDTETAQAAERFNDNLTRLEKVMTGFTNQVMIGALPALEEFSETLQDPATVQAAKALAAGVISAMNGIIAAIRETVNFAQWLGESFAAAFNGISMGDTVRLEQEIAKMEGMLESYDPGERIRLFSNKGIVEYWSDDELKAEIARMKTAIENNMANPPIKIETVPDPGKPKGTLDLDTGDGEGKGKKGRKSGGGRSAGVDPLLAEAKAIYDRTRNSAELYAIELDKLATLQQSGLIDQETYNRAVRDAKYAYEDATEALYQGLRTEEEEIALSYDRRKTKILEATELSELERQDLLTRLQEDFNEKMGELTGENYWERWLESAEKAMLTFDEIAAGVLDNFSSSFGDAFESLIFDSESLESALTKLAENMARGVVNALGQMAAQWLAYQAVQMLVGKSTAAAGAAAQVFEAAAAQQMAGLNAFASTAAIPVVGPAAAPAAAAAAIAATSPFVAAITGLMSAAVGARAMGGPVTGGMPYLIGERGPELFVPNTNGAVVPNGKFGGNSISVNLIEDRSKAGSTEQRTSNGNQELDIFVADIMADGPRSKAIQRAYGLQRMGR